MTDYATEEQFEGFVVYMRQMIADISSAHVGEYINEASMKEVALVWNEGEECALQGYPNPDNLTHISVEPYPNDMPMDSYCFKKVVMDILEAAGYKNTDGMFISEMGCGEFSANMSSGYNDDMHGQIYTFFLRVNGDIQGALDSLGKVSDTELRDHCRRVIDHYRIEIGDVPQEEDISFSRPLRKPNP